MKTCKDCNCEITESNAVKFSYKGKPSIHPRCAKCHREWRRVAAEKWRRANGAQEWPKAPPLAWSIPLSAQYLRQPLVGGV